MRTAVKLHCGAVAIKGEWAFFRAISVDKAGLFSWRLRTRRFVGSVTRRRGGPPSHRPSGRGPRCGFLSDRAIPPPSQAGVGFGLWLVRPSSLVVDATTRHLVAMGSIPNWVTTSAKRTLRSRVQFPGRLAHA